MIPNMPALGIRFDIGQIESGAYGYECWKVLWRAVDAQKLGGVLLFEGDTAATLNRKENVYCIAVQSMNTGVLDEIRAALEQSAEYQKVAASPRFVEGDSVVREPLPDAGRVDSEGNLVGEVSNSRAALGAVRREEKQEAAQAAAPPAAASERNKPASTRTANLPTISSLEALQDYLLTNFGEKNKWHFWVTPEELCDIVEQYADIIQVQWHEDSCGLSEDMTYVTLFNKGAAGRNIALHGLFPFATESAAKEFCQDRNENLDYLIGQLEGLWGIRGRFATNFSGGQHSNRVDDKYYAKERDIDASDLWPRICRRRADLGIAATIETEQPKETLRAFQKATMKEPAPKAAAKKWWQFWK